MSQRLVCFLFHFTLFAHRVLSMRVRPLRMPADGGVRPPISPPYLYGNCKLHTDPPLPPLCPPGCSPSLPNLLLFPLAGAARPPHSFHGAFPSCAALPPPYGSLSALCVYSDAQAISCGLLPPYLGSSEPLAPPASPMLECSRVCSQHWSPPHTGAPGWLEGPSAACVGHSLPGCCVYT